MQSSHVAPPPPAAAQELAAFGRLDILFANACNISAVRGGPETAGMRPNGRARHLGYCDAISVFAGPLMA